MNPSTARKMRSAFEELGCDPSIFSEFTLVEIGKVVFAVSPLMHRKMQDMGITPYACGMEVGRAGARFDISLATSSFAYTSSRRRTIVNGLGEKLFTYGRDVFRDNVVSACEGVCFVLNERGECLGTGVYDGDMLHHRLDVGMYLRGFGDER